MKIKDKYGKKCNDCMNKIKLAEKLKKILH